jgi:hypothetical protein
MFEEISVYSFGDSFPDWTDLSNSQQAAVKNVLHDYNRLVKVYNVLATAVKAYPS